MWWWCALAGSDMGCFAAECDVYCDFFFMICLCHISCYVDEWDEQFDVVLCVVCVMWVVWLVILVLCGMAQGDVDCSVIGHGVAWCVAGCGFVSVVWLGFVCGVEDEMCVVMWVIVWFIVVWGMNECDMSCVAACDMWCGVAECDIWCYISCDVKCGLMLSVVLLL